MALPDIHSILFFLADKLSESINLIFVGFILEEPLILRATRVRSEENSDAPRVWPDTLRFWGRAILGVGAAVALAELGKKMQVWPGHSNFPSGHTTFAASAATILVLRRGRAWLWMGVPLVAIMMAGLAYGGWHTVDEVVAAAFLGPSVAWSVWQMTARAKTIEK